MSLHPFNFDGGIELSDIGAKWFVSYGYYNLLDKLHLNWSLIDTPNKRIEIYNNTKHYHKYWLEKIIHMNNKRLNKNEIGVDAIETKRNANKLLLEIYNKSNPKKKPNTILIKNITK